MLRAALLATCLAAAALPAAGQSLDDLRYRVATLEAELAALRARTGGGGTAGGMMARLDQLEQEVRALTGEVEEMNYRLRRVAEDAGRRFGDIEFRLTELEGGDLSAVAEPAPLGGLGEEAPSADAPVAISERDELDRAIGDIQQARYDQGEERLRRFLATYGSSPLRAEALLWLGESQLTRGAYREAARSFLDGYNADSQGRTAAKSLMKLGLSLGKLGQFKDACLTLREVPKRFPTAEAGLLQDAEAAEDRLGCG